MINPLIVDGSGARRPRAGHRAGAVGGGGVRRRRQPGDRLVRGLPRADRGRPISFDDRPHDHPVDHQPLGTKGVGEAGTIASTPAVVNAIVDAVRQFGVNDILMPCTPERVWRAIQREGAAASDRARPRCTRRTAAARRTRGPRRSASSDPRSVRLRGADLGRGGPAGARRARRRRQGHRRRAEPAPGPADAARRPGVGRRPAAGSTRCAASATTATRSSSAR